MKTIATAALCACMAFSTATVFAQSTSMPASTSKTSMKAKNSTQDCKDRVTTQKGEKRNDTPLDTDADKACGDSAMPMQKGKMKKSMKSDSATTQEMPAAPSK
jgi:hypothetical protein